MLTALMLSLILAASHGDSLRGPNAPGNDPNVSLDTLSGDGIIKPAALSDSIPVFTLKGIVVTATRTPLAQLVAPASVSIIQADSMDPSRGAVTAFSQVSGGNVGITGGLGSVASFNIRGSSSEQVLFLLNGMPLNSALTGGYDLNKITGNIKRIEVVKGPASALYGANALAGVVNIITIDDAPEKPYSKITYQYGKHKQQTMSAILSRQLNRFLSISLSADWKSTDGERPNSDYSGSNYFLGATATPINLLKVGLEYHSYQSMSGSPGSLIYGATLHDRMLDDQQDFYANISYSDLVKIKFGQSMVDNIFYSYDYNSSTRNFSRQNNADVQFNYGFRQKFNVVFGGAYQQVTSESDNSGDHNIDQYSAFINQEVKPLSPWLVVAGVRYDKNSSYPRQISPSISSSWQLTKQYALYATYGIAYRAPTVNELYWYSVYNSPWDVSIYSGNDTLNPEKSNQYEIGYKQENASYNSSICLYQRNTTDLINWNQTTFILPDTFFTQTANLTEVKTTGFEINGGASLLKYFVLNASYNYCLAKVVDVSAKFQFGFSDSNRELNYTPANSANLSFAVKGYPITDHLSLSWQLNTQYKDRQLASHPDEFNPGSELPRYFVSGQTLSLKIRDALLFYKIDNLFNAEYQVRAGYPMPRRSYAFGISMELWN
ncbi:MAG: TonB-dependent receptor [Candidatus Edwardsbacteria bacterium]|nr:TonB-dependent receptor [Candidatus Edwardsbacteria bacterium]MBU2594958.1 TonB-dependent receptor [Candidatus Edwardsbacteria bacterium]